MESIKRVLQLAFASLPLFFMREVNTIEKMVKEQNFRGNGPEFAGSVMMSFALSALGHSDSVNGLEVRDAFTGGTF